VSAKSVCVLFIYIYEEILVNMKDMETGLCAGLFLLCLISFCGFEPKRKSVFSRIQKYVQSTADCVEISY
jgi:hypothetical protein